MDANGLLRWVIVVVLLAHGIGHVMGVLEAWTSIEAGFAERPWLFSDVVTIQSGVGRAFSLLWLVAMIGFVAAGIGLATGQPWWTTLAIVSAVISLVAVVPWFGVMPVGSAIGAILVDVAVIVTLVPNWGEQITRALSV